MNLTKYEDFEDGMLVVYSDVPFGGKYSSDCCGCVIRTKKIDGKIYFTFYSNSHKHKSCTCNKVGDFCHNYCSGAYYRLYAEEVTGVLSIGDI